MKNGKFVLTPEKEIIQRIKKIKKELEELKEEDFWSYTKEYWAGLLGASILPLKEILKDLE